MREVVVVVFGSIIGKRPRGARRWFGDGWLPRLPRRVRRLLALG
ncbi:hypothetical protein AB0I53_21590 [Saccharopolyspora sp. NPDC050389]